MPLLLIGDNIRLQIAEVLLCAAVGNLTRSKKQWDWTPHNAVLLPPFLTEAAIFHGESNTGKILKIFACFITDWEKEGENTSGADDNKYKDSEVTIEAEDEKTTKPGKGK